MRCVIGQRLVFFLICLLATCGMGPAAWADGGRPASAVRWVPDSAPLGARVGLLVDAQGTETIATVARRPPGDFRELQRPLSAGYTRKVHWLRITLDQKARPAPTAQWLLEVGPGYLDDLRLYTPEAGSPTGFREQASGDHQPFTAREYAHRFFAFSLNLPADAEPLTIYLRVQSTSTQLVHLTVYERQAFAQATQGEYLGLGIQLGCLCLMLLYSLLHWRVVRERYLFLFVCLVLSTTIATFGISGLAAQFLFPTHPELANLFAPMGTCLLTLFGLWFSLDFLDIWRRHPGFAKLALLTMSISALGVPGIVFDYYVEIAPLILACTMVSLPFYLWVVWRSVDANFFGGRWIAVAQTWSCLVIGLNQLTVLGIIASPAWVNDWHYNSLVYLMFLMSGVLTRMREMEHVRDQAIASSAAAELRAEVASAQKEEKSKFLSLIAHELKTPLATIDAAVQALRYGNPQAEPAVARRHQRIRDAVARLNTLLEDSLRVARNEKEQPSVFASRERIDAAQLEATLRSHLSVDPGAAPATVHFDFEPGLDLQADGMLLRRALGNLVDNALKYGDLGQPITVRARRQPHAHQPGVAFEVLSAFTGEPAEDLEAWFGKHRRGQNSHDREGMGLGLYLVRSIAQAHGGHAHCSLRQRGGGSASPWLVATLWLPHRTEETTR